MAHVIRRVVEVCPVCGQWDPFRKGPNGKTVCDPRTGLRRVYGVCRNCGAPLVVHYVKGPDAKK